MNTLIVHCTENLIYIFLGTKLRTLAPNFYIHVSVSDLYIPRIGLAIWLQIYKSLTDTLMWNWETELYNFVLDIMRPSSFISGNKYIVTRHLYWILTGPSFEVYYKIK
jgi:hypothetical protein